MNARLPGFGDEATWPICWGAHNDPRLPEQIDQVEHAQDLIQEIREQLNRAETAVFKRDFETYGLAMANAHALAGSSDFERDSAFSANTPLTDSTQEHRTTSP